MDKGNTIIDLIDHCRGHHVYIQTHNFPDPDAIASGYGLQQLFKYFGIESTICYVGRIDHLSTRKMTESLGIDIRSKEEFISGMSPDDYIICVDSQKGAGNIEDLEGDEIAAIDHHPLKENGNMFFSDIRIVGSCATIIAGYFRELGVPVDVNIATALLYGLKTDTLNLTRGVTEEDIDVYGFLFAYADESIIQKLVKNSMEFDDLRAYGDAIKNMVLYDNVGFAKIEFSCPDALVAIVADFILSLIEVEVAVVYATRDDGWKFSVRSEIPSVDAGILTASALNGIGSGGGHSFMAGGMIRLEDVDKLGPEPEDRIQELFMTAIKSFN
ncbi:MAG: DHH family phosphoesterase [Clostridiales bacterium]|nr:DHH family phosphoesterase [Clostridiales bacterium]